MIRVYTEVVYTMKRSLVCLTFLLKHMAQVSGILNDIFFFFFTETSTGAVGFETEEATVKSRAASSVPE